MPRLHPLNDGFTWTDHDGPFRVVTDEQARAYDEAGRVTGTCDVPDRQFLVT